MGAFSIGHWLIILLIVVLIFGTKRLRNVGKDLGGAVHDFKQGLNEGSSTDNTAKPSGKGAANSAETHDHKLP